MSALLGLLVVPAAAAGQSLTASAIDGTVRDRIGLPLQGALVTVTALDTGSRHETTTSVTGAFAFPLVAPGSYEVRAERIGYRPVIARTLVVSGGERGSVSLQLFEAAPPVVTVDTVSLGAASSRWLPGGERLGGAELERLPHRFDDLATAVSLAAAADESLGIQGLPGSTTLIVADGIPVYRAQHPLARTDHMGGPLFPRSAVSSVTAFHSPGDVEMHGSAGGYLSLATRAGTRDGGVEAEGAWSGSPLWSSSRHDFSTPSLASFQGAARTAIPVTPQVSRIVVSAEGLQQETPLAPRAPESIAMSLAGLDPDLVASLSAPSTETFSRYSALARFDAQPGDDRRYFTRGAVAYSRREFEGPGPVGLGPGAALPEESVDYSIAGGLVSERRSGWGFELRGGVSGSDRRFEPAAPGLPAAALAQSRSALGIVPAGAAESSRTDFVLPALLRFRGERSTTKFGISGRASQHAMDHSVAGDYVYSDGAALVAGQGFARWTSVPRVSFSTYEIGTFLQYDVDVSPGLRASFGARYDYERVPRAEASPNALLEQESGLRNEVYPSGFHQVSTRAALAWDPAGDGSTRVFGTVSAGHGDLDPTALAQLFAQDDGATSTRYGGGGLGWPGGGVPGGATPLPTVTLLGPDARPPRTTTASLGLVRSLTGAWTLRVRGSYRRTDFLLRRRDLNLPVLPRAQSADGRDVFGTLQQDGGLVLALDPDGRRFSALGEIWALDPDGWSEYVGGAVGIGYAGPGTTLDISYTRSRTRDNWIGARAGWVGALVPPLLPGTRADWEEGTSDYDVPDRVSAAVSRDFGAVVLSAAYRFRSGLPFTPGYRTGVDANGDGSILNDVAFVDATEVAPLESDWPCLSDQVGGFAVRNSCRGPVAHALDVRVQIDLGRVGDRTAALFVDAFNLVETEDGVVDGALALVDPAGSITTSPDGSTVALPLGVNPDFGAVRYPMSRGRMVRVGLRIGG